MRAVARIPTPYRVYAIGDIHGCATLFQNLLRAIDRDIIQREPAIVRLILLGDVIDRGSRSAELIRMLMSVGETDSLIVLKGNHEAAMVDAYKGDLDALDMWLSHGGKATLAGFGLDADALSDMAPIDALAAIRAAIPRSVIDWASNLPSSYLLGDYLFVHAGIRPGVKLARQTDTDLLWIRDSFLKSQVDHGVVVVHGHSIEGETVVQHANRIGVDTGAYQSGRLSAIALEGGERWILSATDS